VPISPELPPTARRFSGVFTPHRGVKQDVTIIAPDDAENPTSILDTFQRFRQLLQSSPYGTALSSTRRKGEVIG
jgi:hypothetical protein